MWPWNWPWNVPLFGKRVFTEIMSKDESYGNKALSTSIFIKRRHMDADSQGEENAMWRLQLCCCKLGNHQKLRERSGARPSLGPSKGSTTYWHLDLEFLFSSMVRGSICLDTGSVVFAMAALGSECRHPHLRKPEWMVVLAAIVGKRFLSSLWKRHFILML